MSKKYATDKFLEFIKLPVKLFRTITQTVLAVFILVSLIIAGLSSGVNDTRMGVFIGLAILFIALEALIIFRWKT